MNTVLQLPILPTASSQTVAAIGTRFAPKDHHSVKAMSTEFESMFLSQLLKEMRAGLQPGGMFAGDKADIQGGLFDLIMSKHLAEAGGVGLASRVQQLVKTTAPSGNTSSNATNTIQRAGATGAAVSGASGS